LKIWMTPRASVAMLEKLALLRIAPLQRRRRQNRFVAEGGDGSLGRHDRRPPF